MKVLIAVDIEDIHGIAYSLEYEHFAFVCKMCTLDTNAAIEGVLASGTNEINVSNTHGLPNENVQFNKVQSLTRLIRGGKNPPLFFMEGLTEDTDLVLSVGWHDKARGPGVLAHTSASEKRMGDIHINGIVCGEVEIVAANNNGSELM